MDLLETKFQLLIFMIILSVFDSSGTPDCTQKPCQILGKKSIKFFFFADWGGKGAPPYYTDMQMRLADGLAIVDRRERCDFVVTAGDNIYPKGVQNSSDERFQETFMKVFKALARNKPWYIVAGNHDYLGNIDAQIAYHNVNPNWNYPNRYYSFSYQSQDGSSADFFMLDTIMLCGNTLDSKDLISLPGATDQSAADDQIEWLERKLKSSKALYIFIVGHYPVRSKGRNGAHTECMRKLVEPLIIRYDVTAYMSGHDHNLQHVTSVVQGRKLNYIVSGVAAYHDTVQLTTMEEDTSSLFFYPLKPASNVPPIRWPSNDKPGFVVERYQEKYDFGCIADERTERNSLSKLSPLYCLNLLGCQEVFTTTNSIILAAILELRARNTWSSSKNNATRQKFASEWKELLV